MDAQDFWDDEWDDDSDGAGATSSLPESNNSRPPIHSMISVDDTNSSKKSFLNCTIIYEILV